MPVTNTTLIRSDEFLKMLAISRELNVSSTQFSSLHKENSSNHHDWARDEVLISIEKGTLNSIGLKSLIDGFLIQWNESISVETESFWLRIEENNLNFNRKEPLRFALEKGRFFNVHQGMEARSNWNSLVDSGYLLKRYKPEEIEKLFEIISNDEERRVIFLKKCLKANIIPSSQYLKFGDCMAYIYNTRIIKEHFSVEEIESLNLIWKNYKS